MQCTSEVLAAVRVTVHQSKGPKALDCQHCEAHREKVLQGVLLVTEWYHAVLPQAAPDELFVLCTLVCLVRHDTSGVGHFPLHALVITLLLLFSLRRF